MDLLMSLTYTYPNKQDFVWVESLLNPYCTKKKNKDSSSSAREPV